jgi:hypothetical protein
MRKITCLSSGKKFHRCEKSFTERRVAPNAIERHGIFLMVLLGWMRGVRWNVVHGPRVIRCFRPIMIRSGACPCLMT